jgi:PAS domain S-box-containing protein
VSIFSDASNGSVTSRIHGSSAMADLIRALDWSATRIGRIEDWPVELVAAVNTILGSPLPMQIFWGREMTLIYNDALMPFMAGKHPGVLGQICREAWSEAWPTVGAQLEGVLDDGKPVRFDNVLLPILRDGVLEDIYWNYSYSPLYGPTGHVEGILNIAQDITAAVTAQQALRASEARSVRILLSIGDAVIVTDAEARVARMNAVAEALTGWTEAEAKNRPLADVFHIVNETTRQQVESPAEKVRKTGKVVGLANHTILIAKDGRETQIDDSGAPIRDEDGKLSGIVLVFRNIDERRAAEREREHLTQQLSQISNATTDAIVIVNRDWVTTYLNPMAEKMYGAKEAILGRNLWDAFPDAAAEGSPFVGPYNRAMHEGIAGSLETYYPEPLNFWLRLEVYPTRDGIVTFSRDISEEKRALEALRERDERLRMALMAAKTVGTWDWDVATDRVYVNEEFVQFYKVDPEQAEKGLPSEQFVKDVHPDDAQRLGDEITAAMRTGDEYRCEYRLIGADGAVRWVSSAGRCKQSADGTPLRFLGVTVDITDVRKTDEALRRSEESLRIAALTAKLGTWDRDLVTGHLETSGLCKANYGWPLDQEFRHADLLAAIHPEDRPAMEAAVKKAIEDGTDYRAEYRVFWPDGSEHWIRASGHTVDSVAGKAVRFAGVALDVTERHQTQAALMQSEKLAAVGKLAASIAHEINNPLESVTNLLYLARHLGDLSPQAQEYLDTAERELRRVSVISSQTLRFYRQSTRPKPVTCEELFDGASSIFQGRLVNSRVRLEKRLRAQEPVLCFENEIRQVLNNLVGNAIDAMHPNGGRLLLRSVDSTNWKTGAKGIRLSIADTGPGISPSVLARIFEAFFTTKGIGGTGLGLWLSQEIVERHGGVFLVRSSQKPEQHGTVFTVFLPSIAVTR